MTLGSSREALVGLQECKVAGSSKSLIATTSPMDRGQFWVPHSLQKQNSFVQKEIQEHSSPGSYQFSLLFIIYLV